MGNTTKQRPRSSLISLLLAVVMIAQMVLPAFAGTAPEERAASEAYEFAEVTGAEEVTSGDTYAIAYTANGVNGGPILYHKDQAAQTDQVGGGIANGKLILANQKRFPEPTQTWVLTGDAKSGYTVKSCSGTNMYLNLNAVSGSKAPVTDNAQAMTITPVNGGFTIGCAAGEKTLYLAHTNVSRAQYSVAEAPTTLRLFKKVPVKQEPVVPADPLAIPGYTRVTDGTLDPTKVYMIVGQDSAKKLYAFYPDASRKDIDPGNAIDPKHRNGCPAGTFAPVLTVTDKAVTAKRQNDAVNLNLADLHFTLEQMGDKWAIKFKNGQYLALENVPEHLGMLKDSQVAFTVRFKSDGTVSMKNASGRYLNLNVAGDSKQFKPGFATNFWGPIIDSPLPIYLYTKDGESVTPPTPGVDKNTLKTLINKAEGLKNNAAYTQESRDELLAVLTSAQAEMKNSDATEETIQAAADKLNLALQAMVPVDLAPERPNPDHGTTQGQPFINGENGGSKTFRIPAITTLKDGSLAAAIDARWDKCPDGYGIDTLFSVSKDNGATWEYNFPNYFNDSTDAYNGAAAAFIDPVMVQGKDETIYLMVDVFPGGKYIGSVETATGYERVGDQQRLVLYRSQKGQNDSNWAYYVGDLKDGFAPVIAKDDRTGKAVYYVDDHFYLYTAEKKPMYCQQIGSKQFVKQNVFYTNAELHVRNATYLWLVTSTDGGQNWSAPTIMNPMVRPEKATQKFYGVGPGAGLCLSDGTIMLPCYTYPNQIASFIYKKPNDTMWHRSENSSKDWSSESVLVQIDATTVRHFYRDGHSILRYTDHVWDQASGSWKKGNGPVELPGVTKTYNNQLSAIRYTEDLNGKPTILVSTAATGTNKRENGKIYVFNVRDDKTMELISTYQVNKPGVYYGYSSLTVLKDGTIGLLYEDGKGSKYQNITMEEILQGTVVDVDLIKGQTYQTAAKDNAIGKNTNPDVADAVVRTESSSADVINGAYGHEGTSAQYDGALKPLSSALYRFIGNGTDGFQITGKAGDGTKVWVSTANIGAPSSRTPETMNVTANPDGTFYFQSVGYLYFWRNGNKIGSFDRNSTPHDSCKFKLYRPAAKDEASSPDIPGYVQIKTMDEIKDGSFYLIAAVIGQDTYVLRPSAGDGKYAQALKVDKTKLGDSSTVTDQQNTLVITAKNVGVTDIALDNTIYRVRVTASQVVNREKLQAAIDRAEGMNQAVYQAQSWAKMQTALAEAKKTMADMNAEDAAVTDAANKLTWAVQALVPKDLAPERPSPDQGVTNGQPFPAGVPGKSNTFRIPALTTLKDGTLAAAIDARWNHSPDGDNIDTLFSVSRDNGKTWEYSFPNYFNDATDYTHDLSTAFIDPVMVQGKDNTIYLMVDLFPAGHYIGTVANDTGYRALGGKQRLILYPSVKQGQNDWTCYVGDFVGGYAPVLDRNDASGTALYYVDDHYYLYTADKQPMYCQQLGSQQYVRQNVFYYNADLHVRNATYLWLVTSKDDGKTWSAPTIMNPMVRPQADGTTHRFYGVGPGAGLCLSDGTILLPCYTNTPEKSSFIYKNPDETVWHRSENATTGQDWSSENALVEIDGNTVREFCRDGVNVVRYTDHTRNPQTGVWKAGQPVRVNGVPKTTANQVSAIRYSKQVNGQDVILVSTAATGTKDRQNGKIYAFALNQDQGRTMTKIGEYEVTAPGVTYGYSSLTQQEDGSIGLLYEDTFTHGTYRNIQLNEIIPDAVVEGGRKMVLTVYETVEDLFHFDKLPASAELAMLDSGIVKAEIKDGKVFYTGLKAGETSYVTGGVTVTIKVAEPANLEQITLNVGDIKEIVLEKGQLTTNTSDAVVGAEIIVDDKSFEIKNGAQGREGTDKTYSGSLKPLSSALYQFNGSAADGFQIMGRTENGTKVWASTSVNHRPSSSTPENAVLTDNGNGTFYIRLDGGCLFFWRDGRNSFDRVGTTSGFEAGASFKLYRPAAAGEQSSTEIPGYVQAAKLADVKDGGYYLIVAAVGETNFVLRPYLGGGDHSQALKVDLTAPNQTTTVENKFYTLKLTGKDGGTADVVADGQIYRVTVNGASDHDSSDLPTSHTTRYPDGTVVETLTSWNDGTSAIITMPEGLKETTVIVPTNRKPTPGTAAVEILPDGTRRVIRKSMIVDNGVVVNVDSSAKIEIVDNAKSFADTKNHWAKGAIDFVTSHELYAGTSANAFSPDLAMSRGMLAVVLHNREDNPKPVQNVVFTDVVRGTWYSEAVAWAAGQKIVSGYGNGKFGPNDQITREQLAVMLYQYAGSPAVKNGELNFADADQVSGYARTAVCWAVQNGVINGTDSRQLLPGAAATRAQVAAMVLNFCKQEVKDIK